MTGVYCKTNLVYSDACPLDRLARPVNSLQRYEVFPADSRDILRLWCGWGDRRESQTVSPTIDVLGIQIAKPVFSAPGLSGPFNLECMQPVRWAILRLVWSDTATSFGRGP